MSQCCSSCSEHNGRIRSAVTEGRKTAFWSGAMRLCSVMGGVLKSILEFKIMFSLHGEATRLLDRRQQLVVELVVALIGWNVDPIKAGMGFGKVVCVGINLVDGK